MTFVIDAAVADCWLLPDERHSIADIAFERIARPRDRAGDLVVRTSQPVDRQRTPRSAGQRQDGARVAITQGPVTIDNTLEEEALLDLARRRQLSVYDAAYLELALHTGHPLATLDKALTAAARAEAANLL